MILSWLQLARTGAVEPWSILFEVVDCTSGPAARARLFLINGAGIRNPPARIDRPWRLIKSNVVRAVRSSARAAPDRVTFTNASKCAYDSSPCGLVLDGRLRCSRTTWRACRQRRNVAQSW